MNYRFRLKDLRVTRNQAGKTVYFIVEDKSTKRRHRLYEFEYEAARLMDGSRKPEKIAKLVNRKLRVTTEAVDVERFAEQLLVLGFVERV